MTDKERKMEEIRANFTQGSDGYDDRIRKIIPRYDEMLEALMSCIPSEGRRLRAIDIGCGTGAVSELLLRSHPEVDLTCLDMTESMLDRARDRLKAHDNIKFVLADIYDFELDGPYDLVISSLALHHVISDQDKKAIYRKIFDALSPGGWFLNADIVLGSTDDIQEVYMMKWKEFMYQSFTRDETDHVRVPRYHREDSPARLVDHLRWLSEVGFGTVDVVWKYYNFAVYGGRK
jgi:tRNA (cmo5U34)-methyltransferase